MAHVEAQEAAIFILPDELLLRILQEPVHVEYQAFREGFREPFSKPCEFTTARALVLTCRRFHRLVTPLLYADLQIQCNGACDNQIEEIRRTKLLHRTFSTNPSLRTYCKRLDIAIGSSWPFSKTVFERESPVKNLFYIVVDFLNWLSKIAELRVAAWPQYPDYWHNRHPLLFPTSDDLLNLLNLASEQLACLKNLELFTHDATALALPILVTGLGGLGVGACLRCLDLSGVSKGGVDQDWELLRAKAGTAPFTELKLRHFTNSARALEALVMWPSKLTSFEFAMPMSDHHSGESALTRYNLGIMQSILSHQKDSLSYIRIEELLNQGLYDFNVTEFRNLKSLWLSHDLTGTDAASVANLVAPNCEVFYWNMMLEDQQCGECLDAFGKPEEDWLRAFALAAIDRSSSLRHIRILFFPDSYPYSQDMKSLEYPWDRMDRIALDIQPYGIRLSYNTPVLSRKDFDEMAITPPSYSPAVWPPSLPSSPETSEPTDQEGVEVDIMMATQ